MASPKTFSLTRASQNTMTSEMDWVTPWQTSVYERFNIWTGPCDIDRVCDYDDSSKSEPRGAYGRPTEPREANGRLKEGQREPKEHQNGPTEFIPFVGMTVRNSFRQKERLLESKIAPKERPTGNQRRPRGGKGEPTLAFRLEFNRQPDTLMISAGYPQSQPYTLKFNRIPSSPARFRRIHSVWVYTAAWKMAAGYPQAEKT